MELDEKRVYVALDVDRLEKVDKLVGELGLRVAGFKIGLELITAVGGPQAIRFVQARGGSVFYDGKFLDIPNTVAGASKAVTRLGVDMFNVHCSGGLAMMKEARKAVDSVAGSRSVLPRILGVTVLTSRDYGDYEREGLFPELDADTPPRILNGRLLLLVVTYAKLAQEAGLDGVIASPQEAWPIRAACGGKFLIVTPGVRPAWAAANDQKRVTTPDDAIRAGADYLVIGRPITNPPAGIGGPADALKRINEEVAAALAAK